LEIYIRPYLENVPELTGIDRHWKIWFGILIMPNAKHFV